MSRPEKGFSLIEVAIVLVVIGFLIGAVMKGQTILYNARMHKVASDMKEYAHVFLLYYDRYGMYPGDENDASFPAGDTFNGNHNGLIDTANEQANAWQDLSHAMGVVRRTSPVRGGIYEFGSRAFGFGTRNYVSVSQLPNAMAQAMDLKLDDGLYDRGNIQCSASYDGSDTLVTLYWRM